MVEQVKQRRRRKGFTRVSSKNQVTLPIDALLVAGLRSGDTVMIEAKSTGEIILRREEDPLDQFLGVFDGMYPEGYLDELRAEWE